MVDARRSRLRHADDPGCSENLGAEGANGACGAEAQQWLIRTVATRRSSAKQLTAEQAAKLDALGYGGGEH